MRRVPAGMSRVAKRPYLSLWPASWSSKSGPWEVLGCTVGGWNGSFGWSGRGNCLGRRRNAQAFLNRKYKGLGSVASIHALQVLVMKSFHSRTSRKFAPSLLCPKSDYCCTWCSMSCSSDGFSINSILRSVCCATVLLSL